MNMTISLSDFLESLSRNSSQQLTAVLVLGVIFVNGWTDAPNAITSLVASGGMKLKKAVLMAAFFNFMGLTLMTAWNANVAFTIFRIVDFGSSPRKALMGLCAALSAVIVWSALAWCFGIPTSESHGLIAGLTGAAVSVHHGFLGISWQEWIKVLYGLIFSGFLGCWLGWAEGKCLLWMRSGGRIWKAKVNGNNRIGRKWKNRIGKMQIAGAAAMAFMHGAQDGQKFMGVFLMGIFLAKGKHPGSAFLIPLWVTGVCSIVMAAGTAVGGERIIKTVGIHMVKLDRAQGIVADVAAAMCLLFSSIIGVPVSTTHVKTTAIIGIGLASGLEEVNMSIVREMVTAWIITFPCCGVIGYTAAEIFQGIA